MNIEKCAKQFLLMFVISCVIIPGIFFGMRSFSSAEQYDAPVLLPPELESALMPHSGPVKPFKVASSIKPSDTEKPSGDNLHKLPDIKFSKAPKGYFSDALFIGDSRTVGLYEYGNFKKSDFFCSTGMTVIDIFNQEEKVEGIGKVKLKKLLTSREYGKIYIMIGINELGYSKEQIESSYKSLVRYVRKAQPDAEIYLQANLHITYNRSKKDKYFNNKRLNSINKYIETLADNRHIYYIDANERFDDKHGALAKKYTVDDTHLMGKYYLDWCEWIRNHVVIK